MSESHEVFQIGELNLISFECPKCGTEIIFRLDTPSVHGAPATCPTCHELYVEIGQFLAKYRQLFEAGVDLSKRMRLRLRAVRTAE